MKNFFFVLICIILTSCGASSSGRSGETPPRTSPDLSDIYVYRSNTVYGSVLTACAQANTNNESCSLDTLPLIGMEKHTTVDKKVILDRVLVSNKWMGDRFSQVLDKVPSELLKLFESVTMIIIDNNIRPSFYWTKTGAIYLDPSYLWLTNIEKETINKKKDYRSSYGLELPYSFSWRYVKNEEKAYKNYSLFSTEARNIEQIILPVTRILYHELAHANDFFPSTQLPKLIGNSKKIVEVAEEISQYRLSNKLNKLESSTLTNLAKIFYQGKNANFEQKNINLATLGLFFQYDGATHLYSYHTQYEDFAMLLETVMMKYHYDVEVEVGFLKQPQKSNPTCDDYQVGWGSRNRIAAIKTKSRAMKVTDIVFPTLNLKNFYNKIGQESFMRIGEGWCSNLKRIKSSVTEARTNDITLDKLPHFKNDFLSPEY